ncbi:MAG: SpoIIE family protein phosphatase [Proteobacteria bacterium]|nr:SpoIIE family protein phosphatase [Pseudomonadota bacterium]
MDQPPGPSHATGTGEDLIAASGSTGPAWRGALHRAAAQLVENGGRYSRPFESLILILIVLSVASVGLEATAGLPAWATGALRWGEIAVVAVFSVEYLLRIIAAPDKLKFLLSFEGIVDFLSIAPFYLAGIDARWLRLVRMLRLLRVLKLRTYQLESTVAERTLEISQKNALLEQTQGQLNAELEVGRALQVAILPSAFPARSGFDGAARMIPATTMGGDFYDFIQLPGGQIGLVMADVSGKGVPAAFFMAVARTTLRDLAPAHATPGECLAAVNDVLCAENPLDLFVTVFYCMLDPESGVLRYANGGHNPPYLRRADASVEALRGAGGLVLGAMPGVDFPDHTAQLQAGYRLILYTDGVTEAFNDADEPYGEERLIAEVREHGGGAPAALIEHICQGVAAFASGAPQSDDITLLVVSREAIEKAGIQ